ncbi:Fur family transcriptional regulator [Parerythrobacter jejuensis]|uniref:Transcriptional repressor n=1 Tax=Parerythrobacter jejuensis TaxID=795812 RepID=A0A845AYG7_9SPHN|nr:transcriptional repressor [Parerythrobacter jejuensis]MXP31041.1 transcriptional repressor [Parerythrobacter jejuensis]MXP33801.1 transcriptional repressor [Parerythrobacter jejuensis]
MNAHAHTEHAGESLVDAARSALEAKGERWTGMRSEVFEELARHQSPASAYDIADNLSARRGSRVAPNSVYRILDLFVRNNLANRIESANAFLANTHPGCRHDCIFLICDDCGTASHLDDDTLTGALRQAGRKAGFSDVRPVVELRGLCANCA